MGPAMLRRVFLAAFFCTLTALAAPVPWDKPPEQWTEADLFRILRDSPWSPAKFSLESDHRQRRSDPQSGAVTDSPSQAQGAVVRGIVVSRGHPLPAVTVLWWSSRTIRLAESKLLEARAGAAPREKIDTAESPDYVLAVEGDEPLRILRDAQGDLHDSVFLELESGGALDFTSVNYVDETDAATLRSEFHFPRLLNGVPAIDPDSVRVLFHCRASAKKEMPGRSNSLSFRTEFSPRNMRAQGRPDL
jgi:hypothetical protein